MSRVSILNNHLRDYDDKLYCRVGSTGAIDVMRRAYKFDIFTWNGGTYRHLRPISNFIFSLTDDWKPTGRAVDWGIDPLINRLKAMDLWNNPRFAEDLIQSYEKKEKAKDRDFKNSVESFFYDFRRQFARTFDDVNTSTLAKIDRRRLHDGCSK